MDSVGAFEPLTEAAMNQSSIVKDRLGHVLFSCMKCGRPLDADDFFELGMRLPHPAESRDEYFDAELVDSASHASCIRAERAS
jgi:hypothetical protein